MTVNSFVYVTFGIIVMIKNFNNNEYLILLKLNNN